MLNPPIKKIMGCGYAIWGLVFTSDKEDNENICTSTMKFNELLSIKTIINALMFITLSMLHSKHIRNMCGKKITYGKERLAIGNYI